MVIHIKRHQKLPATTLAGSFLTLVFLAATTEAATNVTDIMLFFGLLLVLLISGGILISGVRAPTSAKKRQQIVTFSLLVLVAIMLRSAQSLGIVDGLILLLTTAGIIFYFGRKP